MLSVSTFAGNHRLGLAAATLGVENHTAGPDWEKLQAENTFEKIGIEKIKRKKEK